MGRVKDFVLRRSGAPAETSGLYEYVIPEWYRENLGGGAGIGGAALAERVWAANRCQQMNSQQIASMPVEFHGPDGAEPLWVESPDDNWYPNGIGDALHSIVDQVYGWGFVCLYVTSRYATGYPRTWMVLDSCQVNIEMVGGTRAYKYGNTPLDPDDIVQIDRNPSPRLHGTSALRSYWVVANSMLAGDMQSLAVNQGAYPTVYLKPKRPLTEEQALKLQGQWMQRTAERNGAPPIVPPDIDVNELTIDPDDLSLLDSRGFDVRAICTAYGMPSVLLNQSLDGGLTYQNPQAVGESWWRFELRPTSTRIANALSSMLPRGSYVELKADDTFAPLTGSDDSSRATEPTTNLETALLPTPAPAPSQGG